MFYRNYNAYCNKACRGVATNALEPMPDFQACLALCDGLIGDFDVAQYSKDDGLCTCGQYDGFVDENPSLDCAVWQPY
jgi:hypothetical protein